MHAAAECCYGDNDVLDLCLLDTLDRVVFPSLITVMIVLSDASPSVELGSLPVLLPLKLRVLDQLCYSLQLGMEELLSPLLLASCDMTVKVQVYYIRFSTGFALRFSAAFYDVHWQSVCHHDCQETWWTKCAGVCPLAPTWSSGVAPYNVALVSRGHFRKTTVHVYRL